MSKRAKAREIKAIALPMAGKVTVLVLAVAALGFGFSIALRS
jgi:hypothetical protein